MGKLTENLTALAVGALFLAVGYTLLLSWHPADDVHVHLVGILSLAATGATSLDLSAYATGVDLSAPTGEADLALPLPQSECSVVAARIGAACDGGVVSTANTVRVEWMSSQEMTMVTHPGSDLTLATAPGQADGDLDARVSGGAPPRLCLTATQLQIALGTAGTPVTVAPAPEPPPSCQGLVLRQRTEVPGESLIAVHQVADLALTLTASTLSVRAQQEKVSAERGVQDLVVDGTVEIAGDTPFKLSAAGWPLAAANPADLAVVAAHRFDAEGRSRIPSIWDRYHDQIDYLWPLVAGVIVGGITKLSARWRRMRKSGATT